jgi:uncharacterized protein YbbK (DUF523 family)
MFHVEHFGADLTEPPFLVSACLLGLRCRYDAKELATSNDLRALVAAGKAIPFCPEQAGGLPTPREPAAIEPGKSGADVLDGNARVLTASGRDVTAEFLEGARQTLAVARLYGVKRALLKSRSPSCGKGGLRRLDGGLDAGDGVTAALLRREGIEVVAVEAARAE